MSTEAEQELRQQGRRLERLLRMIFIAILFLCVSSMAFSFAIYRQRSSESDRLDALERDSTDFRAFMKSQREFNKHKADAVRAMADKEN